MRLLTGTWMGQVATSEPVVLHHGREVEAAGRDDARPAAATACWAEQVRVSSVWFPGRPKVNEFRDIATVERSCVASQYLPAASVIEGATCEFGERIQVERVTSRATQQAASNLPELTADAAPSLTGQDVDSVDLEQGWGSLTSRWSAADKPDHLLLVRCDEVNAMRIAGARFQ